MFIIFGSPLFKYFSFFLQMARSKMSLNNLIPIHCIQYTVYSIRSPIPIYERKLCIAFIEKYGQASVCLRWMCDAWGPGEAKRIGQDRIYRIPYRVHTVQAGLGIRSLVLRANRSFFESDRAKE